MRYVQGFHKTSDFTEKAMFFFQCHGAFCNQVRRSEANNLLWIAGKIDDREDLYARNVIEILYMYITSKP